MIRLSFAVTISAPTEIGIAPPDRPVPEPRATNGTPASRQARTHFCTSSALGGQEHDARNGPVGGEAVALVGAEDRRIGDDRAGAQLRPQPPHERIERRRHRNSRRYVSFPPKRASQTHIHLMADHG